MSSDLFAPVAAGTRVAAATTDAAYLRALLACEGALARAQARALLIPEADAARISALVQEVSLDPAALAVAARQNASPIVPLVEALREAAGPELAGHVHLGATSQDVIDSALMLLASAAVSAIAEQLDRSVTVLAGLAREHRDTVMAARSLGLQALPTTFGVKAAGWLRGLALARDRLRACRLPAQLGGAVGLQERADVAAYFAEELGLDAPAVPWHAERSPITDLGSALAGTARALGKVATDVILLSQTEVGEVAESSTGASSAMPHKRNPALSVLVRSAAYQVPAYAQVLYAVGEHERAAGAWQAEWLPLRDCLRLTGGAAETAAELLEGLRVFPDRMRANAAALPGAGVGAAGEIVDRILGETCG